MFNPFSRRPLSTTAPPTAPLEQLDDTVLMVRARQRDAAAFSVLYERHGAQVYRYIAYRTSRQHIAEDLTAEVFLNAWKTVDRYTERGATVRAWLLRLAHNEVVDYYRTRRQDTPLPEHDGGMPSLPGPELAVELQTTQATLIRAIRQLSEEWQQLILLRFVEELSFEEIATIMGKRSGACRVMQHRALARLREILLTEEVKSYD